MPLPGIAYGTAVTPDGRFLVLTLIKLNQVARLDLETWQVVHTLDVPQAPQEVVIRPDGRIAYVSCDTSGQVAEIDLAGWKVSRLIDAGPYGGRPGLGHGRQQARTMTCSRSALGLGAVAVLLLAPLRGAAIAETPGPCATVELFRDDF